MKVLFLGAGASLGARFDHSVGPPLGAKLCEWLRINCNLWKINPSLIEYHGIISRVLTILEKHAAIDNFEVLLEKVSDDERLDLQSVIVFSFIDLRYLDATLDFGFKTQYDHYDSLISKLELGKSFKDWIVVSLNYDVLFEQALERAGIPFQFFNFKTNLEYKSSLNIFKPHGSINFAVKPDVRMSYGEKTQDETPLEPTTHTEGKNGRIFAQFPHKKAVKVESQSIHNIVRPIATWYPMMANYIEGKEPEFNITDLECIRESIIAQLAQVEEIYVVGVKPVPRRDDAIVDEILNAGYEKFTYIGKDSEDIKQIQRLQPKAIVYRNGLYSFLKPSFVERADIFIQHVLTFRISSFF